ncbi:hypothetical protein BDF19DRAFT_434728 [Syncephalis fuscata]|nr:hypothetical protein BDF19DRAFT_434728 [Syncephalis fuscata]
MTRFINVCIVLMAVVGIIITQGPINISAEDEVSDDCLGLNDLATNQAQLCNAPADSGPGRYVAVNNLHSVKILENGCDRRSELRRNSHQTLYRMATNIPRCEATCRQPSLLEQFRQSSLENELCDKCELHYIKSWTAEIQKRYDECVKITAPNNTSENDKLNSFLPNSHHQCQLYGSLVVVVVVALLFNI